jgi:aryl-alcohol dehydrogenase-like predicted oxidoreductase
MLAQLQQEGLIKHLGVSNVTVEQIAEAQSIAPIVGVQNFYNLAHRRDDLIDSLAAQGIDDSWFLLNSDLHLCQTRHQDQNE